MGGFQSNYSAVRGSVCRAATNAVPERSVRGTEHSACPEPATPHVPAGAGRRSRSATASTTVCQNTVVWDVFLEFWVAPPCWIDQVCPDHGTSTPETSAS